MAYVTRWRVYLHSTGELLAEGTIKQCAEKIGIDPHTLRKRMETKGDRRKYDFEELESFDTPVAEAIYNWDAFCEPLRKKYGINVWKGDNEDG